MIILIDAEKAFIKIINLFMISLRKVEKQMASTKKKQ